MLLDFVDFVAEFETEDILDLIEFFFVGVLGFLPLIVIHWAERWPRFGSRMFKRALWRASIIKTSLFIVLTDWLFGIEV